MIPPEQLDLRRLPGFEHHEGLTLTFSDTPSTRLDVVVCGVVHDVDAGRTHLAQFQYVKLRGSVKDMIIIDPMLVKDSSLLIGLVTGESGEDFIAQQARHYDAGLAKGGRPGMNKHRSATVAGAQIASPVQSIVRANETAGRIGHNRVWSAVAGPLRNPFEKPAWKAKAILKGSCQRDANHVVTFPQLCNSVSSLSDDAIDVSANCAVVTASHDCIDIVPVQCGCSEFYFDFIPSKDSRILTHRPIQILVTKSSVSDLEL
jgi:hypothetical protein